MRAVPTPEEFHPLNQMLAESAGVEPGARRRGYLPAFRDTETGRTLIARYADGRRALIHVVEGLPEEWVDSRDARGRVTALKASVIAGFVRDGEFRTREELALYHADHANHAAQRHRAQRVSR